MDCHRRARKKQKRIGRIRKVSRASFYTEGRVGIYTEGVGELQPRVTPWVNSHAKTVATLKGLLASGSPRTAYEEHIQLRLNLSAQTLTGYKQSENFFPQGVTLGYNSPTVRCKRQFANTSQAQAFAEAPSFFLAVLSVMLSINLVLPT